MVDVAERVSLLFGWMAKKWMINPFSKEQNTFRETELVQQYVKQPFRISLFW